MKGLVCKVCGYLALGGNAPEKCPVCAAPASAFENKEDAVKMPAEAGNLTELEKKHVPVIKIVKTCGLLPEGCLDVHAKIGEIAHPMLSEHFIGHIDFYLDKEFLARLQLTPEKLNAAAAVHLKAKQGVVTALASCNLHGRWISEAAI